MDKLIGKRFKCKCGGKEREGKRKKKKPLSSFIVVLLAWPEST